MPGSDPAQQEGRSRDRQVALILGTFFVVLALPVAVGTLFAELAIDRGINLAAGLILGAVGACFLTWGGRGGSD